MVKEAYYDFAFIHFNSCALPRAYIKFIYHELHSRSEAYQNGGGDNTLCFPHRLKSRWGHVPSVLHSSDAADLLIILIAHGLADY